MEMFLYVNFIYEKKNTWFQKILSSTMVFKIDIFSWLEYQISTSEWFLKDHVKVKTRVMAAENSAHMRVHRTLQSPLSVY